MEATQVCPQCHGAKLIDYEEATVECPTCEGEGMVDAAAADVYMQEQLALCDCPGGPAGIDVIAGQNRCSLCGRLVEEVR